MRPYKRPISALWWTKKRSYTLFILRELTSVFVWVYLLTYLEQLSRLAQGTESYLAFRDERASVFWVLFHIIALVAAVYHTVTFLNASPQAIVVRIGEDKVPPAFILGPQYAAWVAISAAIYFIVVR
jgi:fumarate reductase subunit C